MEKLQISSLYGEFVKKKRTFLVTPDIFKYEEEFVIEAEDFNDLLKQLQAIGVNCIYCVCERAEFGVIRYHGLFQTQEGEPPKYLGSSIQIHGEEDTQ